MKIYFFLILLCSFSTTIFAQHCPFDGATLIVVKLTDQNGKPVKNAKISLKEIENDNAESCSFAKGLLNKEFKPTKSVLNSLYKSNNLVKQYCADCQFLDTGFYAVKLNMSEETCMIKNGNDYKYQKRKFEINVDNKTFKVEQKDIHSLCLGQGKWSRIKPIELEINVDKEIKTNQKVSDAEKTKGESLQTLETRQYDIKGCIHLWFGEKTIKNQTDFLQAIRNDASRERCLQNLEKVDFDKYSLYGIDINSGYCRYPIGLKWEAVEDSTKKEVSINISYLKPDGLCRALSKYDLWLLLPKIPTDYQVKYKVFATEKLEIK